MRLVVMLLLLLAAPVLVGAEPDRAGLIKAWEAGLAREGRLEAQPDGSYRFESDALDYRGGLQLLAALVRRDRPLTAAMGGDIQAQGSVDFELSDLSPAQREASAWRQWSAEHQHWLFDGKAQAWVPMQGYFADRYRNASDDAGLVSTVSTTWWFGDIGLLLGLTAIVVLLLVAVARQQRKAGKLIAESREINALARLNLQRAGELHEANAAAVGESLQLQRRNADALEAILAELRRARS